MKRVMFSMHMNPGMHFLPIYIYYNGIILLREGSDEGRGQKGSGKREVAKGRRARGLESRFAGF
jgi:hypothetical protein